MTLVSSWLTSARQLRMYAQLTRCFSAVAELLVTIPRGLLLVTSYRAHQRSYSTSSRVSTEMGEPFSDTYRVAI